MEFELLCMNCKHYVVLENKCNAFPDGIPYEVYVGLNDHSEKIKGQSGNDVFELISKKRIDLPEYD